MRPLFFSLILAAALLFPKAASAGPNDNSHSRPWQFSVGMGPTINLEGGGALGRFAPDFHYHFKRGAYVAALNRGKHVVENYPQTPAVADGLAVMVQAYLLLGMDDLAQDSLKVLKENYPQYPAIDENGNFVTKFRLGSIDRSWTNKLTLGVFDEAEPPSFDTRPEWEK